MAFRSPVHVRGGDWALLSHPEHDFEKVAGAVARQKLNYGEAIGYCAMAGESFPLKEGTDGDTPQMFLSLPMVIAPVDPAALFPLRHVLLGRSGILDDR
jgi:hypothetical protein